MGKPSILILGAGYAGITTAIMLQKKLHKSEATITLINKHAYHYQTTWLHESAAGTLSDHQTKIPIETIIDTNKIEFIVDTVTKLKTKEQRVHLKKHGDITYDYLVVALGFETKTYNIPGINDYAHTINSVDKAGILRQQLEKKLASYRKLQENQPFTIVIGGGGFTGVEYLGELTDQLPTILEKYQLNEQDVKVLAIEKEQSVMPGFDLELGEYAMQVLENKGVSFYLGAAVKSVYADYIVVEKNGLTEEIPASIFIWSAGVRANHLIEQSDIDHVNGSVEVTDDLRAPNSDNVFVIGDCTIIRSGDNNQIIPSTAQLAIQQGKVCAKNIENLIKQNSSTLFSFMYKQHGLIASLGKKDAIGVLFNNRKVFGKEAALLKRINENRVLHQIGGLPLLWRRRK
ncbi:NADH dehydrogenase-like protein [Paraliobacillus sp. PM-2]|uniref:NAD(P)/FAD-dependent oxidoreductase n=1 Tax=Paraliobacillus sp. PM-2 TaxID=1462524 RepID=UPI00061C177A|nr:NAD(P)/FAD-dependent oxidoreductase [Paraliobacillus sp. PM-2]CQR48226.1 NADH dehydrogenase-like protein [Paraliobacillus sp. PM-2]